MKINTDGVLLGAMVDCRLGSDLLDIGTGTGVVALMLAQRYPSAKIDAVEVDIMACNRARQNFENSPFKDRLCAIEGSFVVLPVARKYDHIVSNPPFYTNSLHNLDARRKLAKHTDLDFFGTLLDFATVVLRDNGCLTLVLPPDLSEEIQIMGKQMGLAVYAVVELHSFEDSSSIRHIVSLRKAQSTTVSFCKFVIYKDKGVYSEQYKAVLKDFFLAF